MLALRMWQEHVFLDDEVRERILAGELAKIIIECDGLARNLHALSGKGKSPVYLKEVQDDFLDAMAETMIIPGGRDALERELRCMMAADVPMTWDESSLPVPDDLWGDPFWSTAAMRERLSDSFVKLGFAGKT